MKSKEYMVNLETGETREFNLLEIEEQGGIPEGFIPAGDIKVNEWIEAYKKVMSKKREDQLGFSEEIIDFVTEGLNKLLKNIGTCDYDRQVMTFIDGFYAKLGFQVKYNSINKGFAITSRIIPSDLIKRLNQELKDKGTTTYVEKQENIVQDKVFTSYEIKTNDPFIFNNLGIVYNDGLYELINEFFSKYGIKLNYNNTRNMFWV